MAASTSLPLGLDVAGIERIGNSGRKVTVGILTVLGDECVLRRSPNLGLQLRERLIIRRAAAWGSLGHRRLLGLTQRHLKLVISRSFRSAAWSSHARSVAIIRMTIWVSFRSFIANHL